MLQMTTRRWSVSSDDLPSQLQNQENCFSQFLPESLGLGRSSSFQLDQGLSYIATHYEPTRNLAVLSRIERQEPLLMVTLDLKGASRFVSNNGDELFFSEGHTTITAIQSSIGERQYEANMAVTQIRFALNKDWLDKYFGEDKATRLLSKSGIQLLSYRPISPQAMVVAQQLLTGDKTKETNSLIMHGQALSLLAFELGHLCVNQLPNPMIFTQRDAEIARAARDILLDEFKNPPSVDELASRVGINSFKLKKLFHHFFDDTPYSLLLKIRMNTAYHLLEQGQCHVGVVADMVGYGHANNFSTAFINQFGISPKALQKH